MRNVNISRTTLQEMLKEVLHKEGKLIQVRNAGLRKEWKNMEKEQMEVK